MSDEPSEIKPIVNEGSSLLMSDDLYDNVNFDDETKELVQERTKIVAIKTKVNGENDAILGTLRGIGTNSKDETLSIELECVEDIISTFLLGLRTGLTCIYGIEIHMGKEIINIFEEREKPVVVKKCNVYDISVQSEQATLVIVLDDDEKKVKPI